MELKLRLKNRTDLLIIITCCFCTKFLVDNQLLNRSNCVCGHQLCNLKEQLICRACYVPLGDEKVERKGRREDQGASFHPGLLVDYLAGYWLDPCFKRGDIGVRTKDLYEYAIYMREQGFLGNSLLAGTLDADLYFPEFPKTFINLRHEILLFFKKRSSYLSN